MTELDHNDLGLVDDLNCDAIGEPGKRTFNLSARSNRGEAIVWMEKEQLFQVAVSLKQLLVARESPVDPAPFKVLDTGASLPVRVEFKTGEMSLRHDPESDVFTLVARDIQREENDSEPLTEITFSFSRDKADDIFKRSLKIVAAGRKPCPLCEAPITLGEHHFCVKVNGHNPAEDPMAGDNERSR